MRSLRPCTRHGRCIGGGGCGHRHRGRGGDRRRRRLHRRNDLDDSRAGVHWTSPSALSAISSVSVRSSLPSTDWPSCRLTMLLTATSSTSSPTPSSPPPSSSSPWCPRRRPACSCARHRRAPCLRPPPAGPASTAPRQQHGTGDARSPRPRRSRVGGAAPGDDAPTPCGRPRCCCAPTSEGQRSDGRGDARVRRGTEGPEFAQVIAERRRPR